MISFKNSFQKHEQMRQLLDRGKHRVLWRFSDSIYNKINMDRYSKINQWKVPISNLRFGIHYFRIQWNREFLLDILEIKTKAILT